MGLAEVILEAKKSGGRTTHGPIDLPDGRSAYFKYHAYTDSFFVERDMLRRFAEHSFAPKVIEIGETGNYILFERIEGRDGNEIYEDEVPSFSASCLDALSVLHEEGYVHRDIKETNAMVDNDGNFYLLDYELARVEGQLKREGEVLRVMGTPRYIAPETLKKGLVHRGNDVWAAGVMAYHQLTHKSLFSGTNIGAVFDQIARFRGKVIYEKNPEIQRVLRMQLRPSPHRRISAKEAAAAWRGIATSDHPALQTEHSPWYKRALRLVLP